MKKVKKKIKKFKKKSPLPTFIYNLGLWTKTFFALITGFSFITIAIGGTAYAENITSFFMNNWIGRILLFLLGFSLVFYYFIELIRKSKKAPKMIKKL